MCLITKNVVMAFLNKSSKAISNTSTNGTSLFLHGNEIARHGKNGLEITDAGLPTVTTKDRLNALPGVSINQKNGKWFLNGKLWDGKWTVVNA